MKRYRGLQCQIRVKSKAERASAYGDGATEKWWQSDNIVWKYRWLSVIRGPCCGWLGPSPHWWQKNVTWEQRNCRLQLPSDIHGEKCFGTRTNTSRSEFGKEEKQKSVTVKTVKAKDTAPLPLMTKFLFWIYLNMNLNNSRIINSGIFFVWDNYFLLF